MAESVAYNIIAHLKSTLESEITLANGYHFDLQKVWLDEMAVQDRGGHPNITIYEEGENKETIEENPSQGFVECDLNLTFDCIVFDSIQNDTIRELRRFASDVEKAITKDPSRGGIAQSTRVTLVACAPNTVLNYSSVWVGVLVKYAHNYNNPEQAR